MIDSRFVREIPNQQNIKKDFSTWKTTTRKLKENLSILSAVFQSMREKGLNEFNTQKAAINVVPDMHALLLNLGIHAHKCNIIQEILFGMAGITAQPRKFHLPIDTYFHKDTKRLKLTIEGITKKEADELVAYFKRMGDESAFQSRSNPDNHDYLKLQDTFKVDIDRVLFYKNIYPLFKRQIQDIYENEPDLLQSYRDKSREYLLKEEIDQLILTLNTEKDCSTGEFLRLNALLHDLKYSLQDRIVDKQSLVPLNKMKDALSGLTTICYNTPSILAGLTLGTANKMLMLVNDVMNYYYKATRQATTSNNLSNNKSTLYANSKPITTHDSVAAEKNTVFDDDSVTHAIRNRK